MTSRRALAPLRASRVFVVDDHPIVRQGLASLIACAPDLTVCGEAEAAGSALQAIETLQPDILIVDISLNGPTGMDLLKSVRAKVPNLPVLILSMHDESVYAERALRAGANGYIMKQAATEEMLTAIRQILDGEIYVSDRLADKILRQFVRGSKLPDRTPVDDLTDRELEVFRLIGEGHGTRQIAEELHLSIKTVESYQSHIKEKMALRNGRELVQHAIEWTIGNQT
jgi:DNA-binding NarL/FixJ family response regulator